MKVALQLKTLLSCMLMTSLRDGKSSHIRVPTQKEFDFLLLSAEQKLIIAIEAKRSLPNQPFKQLREYQEIFEEGLGDVHSSSS